MDADASPNLLLPLKKRKLEWVEPVTEAEPEKRYICFHGDYGSYSVVMEGGVVKEVCGANEQVYRTVLHPAAPPNCWPEMENAEEPPEMENAEEPPEMENAEDPPEMGNAEDPPEMENAEDPPEMENAEDPPELTVNEEVATNGRLTKEQRAELRQAYNLDVKVRKEQVKELQRKIKEAKKGMSREEANLIPAVSYQTFHELWERFGHF